jgi:hypothetical protein
LDGVAMGEHITKVEDVVGRYGQIDERSSNDSGRYFPWSIFTGPKDGTANNMPFFRYLVKMYRGYRGTMNLRLITDDGESVALEAFIATTQMDSNKFPTLTKFATGGSHLVHSMWSQGFYRFPNKKAVTSGFALPYYTNSLFYPTDLYKTTYWHSAPVLYFKVFSNSQEVQFLEAPGDDVSYVYHMGAPSTIVSRIAFDKDYPVILV